MEYGKPLFPGLGFRGVLSSPSREEAGAVQGIDQTEGAQASPLGTHSLPLPVDSLVDTPPCRGLAQPGAWLMAAHCQRNANQG